MKRPQVVVSVLYFLISVLSNLVHNPPHPDIHHGPHRQELLQQLDRDVFSEGERGR